MTYEIWLEQVKEALCSINMEVENWQGIWPFDFSGEHNAGTTLDKAANEGESVLVASAKQVSETELPPRIGIAGCLMAIRASASLFPQSNR